MVTGIDHVVIAVPDLDEAEEELASRGGLAVSGGGRHPGAGTVNRIAFLADGAYLELIAVEDRAAAETWGVGRASLEALDAHGGGVACYALRDDELETTVAALQANGSSIGPAQHGSRQRPDGEPVEWWTAVPERIGLDGVPFLIQHAFRGAEWGEAALAERRTFRHPLGSPAVLLRIDVATPDPPALAATYHRELGLEFRVVADLAICSLGSHVIRLVPRREMPVPATVVIGAEVDGPHAATLLGLQLDVEPVRVAAALAR